MSTAVELSKAAHTGARASQTPLAQEDQKELDALEAAFTRIRKAVPEDPYILTAPCAEPRHHYHSRQEAESWMLGNLFESTEERFQYVSFLYREHGDSCFVCRTMLDEERDRLAAMGRSHLKDGLSGSKTPLKTTGVTKKISLSAFKNKQASGQSATPKKPAHLLNGDKQHELPAKPEVNGEKKEPDDTAKEVKAEKRPLEEPPLDFNIATEKEEEPDTAPPAKRPRTSPPPAVMSHVAPSHAPDARPHGLPPLLSPTYLPSHHHLPPILSPTLPASIEEELAKLPAGKRAVSSTPSSAEKKPRAAPAVQPPAPAVKDAEHGSTPRGLAQVLNSQGFAKSRAPISVKDAEKSIRAAVAGTNHATKPAAAAEKPPKRLIVKLKYSKRSRKTIESLLRFPGGSAARKRAEAQARKERDARTDSESERPIKKVKTAEPETKREPPAAAKHAVSKEVPPKEAAPKSVHPKPMHAAKRPPPDDPPQSEPPAKKPKPPPSQSDRRPQTPTQAVPSPAAAASARSSAQKPASSQLLTPRKDIKSSTMSRTISSESANATPNRSDTPLSKTASNESTLKAPTSAPLVNGKASESQNWNVMSRRLNELGRKLKHSSSSLLQKEPVSSQNRKLSAVQSLECILCYMAAYYCADLRRKIERRPPEVDQDWKTLVPLWRFIGRSLRDYPHLEGLRMVLGGVLCARIVRLVAERKPDEGSAKVMAEHAIFAEQHLLEAYRLLSLPTLLKEFPSTWKAGTQTDAPMAASDSAIAESGALPEGFTLPIAGHSSPLQAVRFGMRVLREWMRREGVEYELEIKLDGHAEATVAVAKQ